MVSLFSPTLSWRVSRRNANSNDLFAGAVPGAEEPFSLPDWTVAICDGLIYSMQKEPVIWGNR